MTYEPSGDTALPWLPSVPSTGFIED